MDKQDNQQRDQGYSDRQAKDRLQAMLRGAFHGPPTPLKDIPKKNGESRSLKKKTRRKKGNGR